MFRNVFHSTEKLVSLLYIFLGLLLLVSVTSNATESVQEDKLWNYYSISRLNIMAPPHGTFHTQGYVKKTYSCPPCEDEECEPCWRDYIVISEGSVSGTIFSPEFSELMIFVDKAEQFRLGEQYLFLIQVLDLKSSDHLINNIKLVHYEKIEEVN